ncbi:hypothetical protein FACS189491_07690 [Spirochaetia bacterium]|nr:hypothetical protein FACS189491_07690 [Spirochaetia bacterium]
MKHWFIIICFAVLPSLIFADNEIESHTSIQLYAPTVGGASFGVLQDFVFPHNNIALNLGLNISPVSFNLLTQTTWMPIPFLKLYGGIKAGTGWNYEDMFGNQQNGMGIYRYDDAEGVDGSGFDGIVWKARIGTTFQFDFAAINPGDWHHVIITTNNEIQYQEFTKVKDGGYWYYHEMPGDGFSQNSFNYHFTGILGYQMPIFIDFTALVYEVTVPFYNPYSGKNLSSTDPEHSLTLLTRFKVNKHFNIALMTNIKNGPVHPIIQDMKREWKLKFFSTQVVLTYKFK